MGLFDPLIQETKEIGAGKPKPAYLIVGADEFLLSRYCTKLLAALREKFFDAEYEQVEAGETARLSDVLFSPSLFCAKRIVWVRGAEEYLGKGAPPLLKQAADTGLEGVVLVVSAAKAERKNPFVVWAEKNGVLLEAEAPDLTKPRMRDAFYADVAREVAAMGKKLPQACFVRLIEKTGPQLRQFYNELEKLVVYAGDRPVITEEDVEALVGESSEKKFYNLTEALGERNCAKALEICEKLFRQGEAGVGLARTLRRHFKSLAVVKGLFGRWGKSLSGKVDAFYAKVDELKARRPEGAGQECEEMLRLHPYRVYNCYLQSLKYSEQELEKILLLTARAETGAKAFSFAEEAYVEQLVARIALGHPGDAA